MPDHCRISSEIRTSFGDLEIADLALVFDRLGVLNLLTPIVNLSIRFRTDAVELAGVVMQSSQKSSLKTPAASAGFICGSTGGPQYRVLRILKLLRVGLDFDIRRRSAIAIRISHRVCDGAARLQQHHQVVVLVSPGFQSRAISETAC